MSLLRQPTLDGNMKPKQDKTQPYTIKLLTPEKNAKRLHFSFNCLLAFFFFFFGFKEEAIYRLLHQNMPPSMFEKIKNFVSFSKFLNSAIELSDLNTSKPVI